MGQLCSTPPKTTTKASIALSQEYKGVLFESINGDIIDAEAEAIINAANSQLIHNNGLGNSLLAKGGQTIQEESNKVKQEFEAEIPIGQAVVTSAGTLKAKYIIHVISPIWNGGSNNEEVKLGECVTNALAQAEKHKLKSIAVPSLDGGVFGFPRENAAKIIVQQCVQYIDAHQPTSIQNIKFINTNAVTVSAFKTAIQTSLLKAGGLNGESVTLAREDDLETRENISIEREPAQEERKVRSARPVEHPVEQRPEVVETVSEEKREEVPVAEVAIEQVAEKTVEQAIEQAVEQVVEEKQQEEVPAVVEPVVEEQPAVVEEKQEEAPAVVEPVVEEKPVEEVVEQPAAVEEQAAVVEEQAAVVEEQAAVVEEQAAVVEEQAAAVEEPVVEEQPAAVEEKQEEAPAVVEEKQEEAPAVVEEKQEEAPAVVEPVVEEEQKTEEVAADETKTEATNDTQETKETEATEAAEEGEAAAEEAGEQGGKKKKNKKKGKRN